MINIPVCSTADVSDLLATSPACTDNAPIKALTKIGKKPSFGDKPTCFRKTGIHNKPNAVKPIKLARTGFTVG